MIKYYFTLFRVDTRIHIGLMCYGLWGMDINIVLWDHLLIFNEQITSCNFFIIVNDTNLNEKEKLYLVEWCSSYYSLLSIRKIYIGTEWFCIRMNTHVILALI